MNLINIFSLSFQISFPLQQKTRLLCAQINLMLRKFNDLSSFLDRREIIGRVYRGWFLELVDFHFFTIDTDEGSWSLLVIFNTTVWRFNGILMDLCQEGLDGVIVKILAVGRMMSAEKKVYLCLSFNKGGNGNEWDSEKKLKDVT